MAHAFNFDVLNVSIPAHGFFHELPTLIDRNREVSIAVDDQHRHIKIVNVIDR